jgi:hypothetical protein
MRTPRPVKGRSRAGRGSTGSAGAGGLDANFDHKPVQLVVDPGFASAPSHTLGGSGIGTSSVTGGVLQITSTDNVYYERPQFIAEPLTAGTYTVVYTILNYSSGTISITSSSNPDLTVGTNRRDGTNRAANGTFTESLVVLVSGYIGLRGQGAAVVNSLQVDNLTVTRAA